MLSRERLEEALAAFGRVRVAVVGDFYLDRYVVGTAQEISREAPIPVVRVEQDVHSPGAAGNTALNVRALGARTYVVGVIGRDPAGETMRAELARLGVDASGLIGAADRHTPTYTKVYASSFHGQVQQVARFDRENTTGLSEETEAELVQRVARALKEMDAVVLQDQTEVAGTGVITQRVVQAAAARADRLSVGDSRNRLGGMVGVGVVVPNEYEATVAAGVHGGPGEPITDDRVNQAGQILLERLGSEHVIVTRGGRGATLFSRGRTPVAVPTVPAEGPLDVTGAGDTMTAAVAVGMAAGLDAEEAAALGNLGAGVTVRKLGTTGTATPDELRAAWARGPKG